MAMNRGSKAVIGLLVVLGVLQFVHAFMTYSQMGRVDWLKILVGLAWFIVSISGYYWVKRHLHRS